MGVDVSKEDLLPFHVEGVTTAEYLRQNLERSLQSRVCSSYVESSLKVTYRNNYSKIALGR